MEQLTLVELAVLEPSDRSFVDVPRVEELTCTGESGLLIEEPDQEVGPSPLRAQDDERPGSRNEVRRGVEGLPDRCTRRPEGSRGAVGEPARRIGAGQRIAHPRKEDLLPAARSDQLGADHVAESLE